MIIKISNEGLAVKIDTLGGQLNSIMKNGKEYLWQGDANIWNGQAPLLFPIVGGLENNTINIRGKQCIMGNHGFLKEMELEVISQEDETLVLGATYTEDTLKCYPFKFKMEITYSVKEQVLDTSYIIYNLDDEEMVYNFGLHPAFHCNYGEEKFEDFYLEFPEEKTLETCIFNENIRTQLDNKKVVVEDSKYLPLHHDLFHRTIIITDIDFDKVWIGYKEKGRIIQLSYNGFDIFSLWQVVGAPYICLEPWDGMNGIVQNFERMEDSPLAKFLPVGGSKKYHMSIDIIE